jgi:hypothetical protein
MWRDMGHLRMVSERGRWMIVENTMRVMRDVPTPQPLGEKCKEVYDCGTRLMGVLCLPLGPEQAVSIEENYILKSLAEVGECMDFAIGVMEQATKFIEAVCYRL